MNRSRPCAAAMKYQKMMVSGMQNKLAPIIWILVRILLVGGLRTLIAKTRRGTICMPSALEADVSALFVEAVFYGVYLSTLLHCLRLLVYAHDEWKPLQLINWPLLALALAIWATSSLDLALSFRRSIARIQGHYSAPTFLWSNTLMV